MKEETCVDLDPSDVSQLATVKYELGFDHFTLDPVANPTRIEMDIFVARTFKGMRSWGLLCNIECNYKGSKMP